MPWSHPAARMREFVLALRAIWGAWQDGTKLDFRGDYYSHTLMTPAFDPGPLPGGHRVLLAAVGTAMNAGGSRSGGRFAGARLHHPPLSGRGDLTGADRGAGPGGPARDGFEVKYSPFVVTGDNEAEMADAADEARERIAFYASTPAYRPVLELHGWGDLQTELNAMARKGEWKAMGGLIDDEVLEAFALIAPRPDLPAALGQWVRGLADRTGLAPAPGTDPERTAEMLEICRASAGAESTEPGKDPGDDR